MPNEIAAFMTERGYVICGSKWVVSCCSRDMNVNHTRLMTSSYASPGGRTNRMMTATSHSVVKDKT